MYSCDESEQEAIITDIKRALITNDVIVGLIDIINVEIQVELDQNAD